MQLAVANPAVAAYFNSFAYKCNDAQGNFQANNAEFVAYGGFGLVDCTRRVARTEAGFACMHSSTPRAQLRAHA